VLESCTFAEIMQKAFEKEEQATWQDMNKHLYSTNW